MAGELSGVGAVCPGGTAVSDVSEVGGAVWTARELESGAERTTRSVGLVGRTATARAPPDTRLDTLNWNVLPLEDAWAVTLVVQLNVGASLIGPPCSGLIAELASGQSSRVTDGVVPELGATARVSVLAVAPTAN